MALYAVTIFASAFLLFQVQPLVGKIILPWFGGSAAVWSAALLFFQLTLLAGYAYAHWLIARLRPRAQAVVHGTLLLVSCALLPILPSPDWRPADAGDPTLRILALLAASVGLPYFLLSSTSPLLQAWYARRTGSQMPYRLFALSNFGSLLALLSFPFVVEPYFTSPVQAYGWSGLYVIFALLCGYTAWRSRMNAGLEQASERDDSKESARPTVGQRVLWVMLAACASTMLMAVTQHLTQNVAPVPMLWVLPLAIYLLTFILAFESDRFYRRQGYAFWLASALGWMVWALWANDGNPHIRYAIPIFLIGLFIACFFCHGELAARRPPARYLTQFYLMVALGGALGGIFVALIAPHLFATYLELPLVLVAIAAMAVITLWPGGKTGGWALRAVLILGVVLLAGYLAYREKTDRAHALLMARNFYGVLSVRDEAVGTPWAARYLQHGVINHGSQRFDAAHRYTAGGYHGPTSGVGRAMTALRERGGPLRYGVVGLGAGVMAAYARRGDTVRLYEINPAVSSIAQREFSFVPHARELGADVEIFLGDGRLLLERQPRQNFDLLVADAFTADAVPVHLLTQEAIGLYLEHLKPDGVLALNVTNRYINLTPICVRAAEHFNLSAVLIEEEENSAAYGTSWMLLTARPEIFKTSAFTGANLVAATAAPGFKGWTDRYSSLWPLLKLK